VRFSPANRVREKSYSTPIPPVEHQATPTGGLFRDQGDGASVFRGFGVSGLRCFGKKMKSKVEGLKVGKKETGGAKREFWILNYGL
jgi:hypothetical protein